MVSSAQILLVTLLALSVYGYSSSLASQLTHMAAIAYEEQSSIESWSCQYCKKFLLISPKVVQNSTGSIFGFVGYEPKLNAIIVSFRGSTDLSNWILNLATTRTSYPLCKDCSVHVGFNSGYNMVKAQVQQHVNHLLSIYHAAKIYPCGHSLGGALAVMAAADLHALTGLVDQLYTMGQPRVGNDVFAKYMTAFIPNTFRVVDYADQVPHVPQSILGFKHSGWEVWYQRGMASYKICPSESKECSNQFTILTLNQADHKMVLYIQLKVDNTLASVKNMMKFNIKKIQERDQVHNFDQKTMKLEDEQIRSILEQLRKKEGNQSSKIENQ